MRPSDLVVLIAAATVVTAVARGGWRLRRTGGLLLVASLVMQVADGWRWQLAPALVMIVVGVAGLALSGRRGASLPVRGRRTVVAIAAVPVLTSVALAAVLPVTGLPEPTGSLPIGTVTFTVEDAGRMDPYAPTPGPRRFPVQVWYPAQAAGPPEPWIAAEHAAAFSSQVTQWLQLPSFSLRHLRLVPTHASAAVPPRPGPHPVVVYSHGWGGFRSIQSDLAEDLASHGYVVIAPDHTYGALATRFPGGEVVGIEPSALPEPEDVSEDEYDRAARLLEQTYTQDLLAAIAVVGAPADQRLLPDATARNVLEALDVDLTRIVMTGHSTGGGAATWACHELRGRCDGVVGFDPWLAPVPDDYLAAGSAVPYVALRSEEWLSVPNDEVVRDYLGASSASTWALAIPGSNHRDFTLMGFLSPLARALGMSGDVAPSELHTAINAVTRALAEHATRGAPPTSLDHPDTSILTPR